MWVDFDLLLTHMTSRKLYYVTLGFIYKHCGLLLALSVELLVLGNPLTCDNTRAAL